MSWLDKQVSLYETHSDNIGRAATFSEILFWEYRNDMSILKQLRELDMDSPNYKTASRMMKAQLQCYTPAGLLTTKASGKLVEISRSAMLQLDFDYQDIKEYDVEDLKKVVFDMPYTGYCGLSCSGKGFYALIHIAEPERLAEYAEHLFLVFEDYGYKPDESKGKKVENLRYLSYDENALYREHPEPLKIKNFRRKEIKKHAGYSTGYQNTGNNQALINSSLRKIRDVKQGQRWLTVQQVAFTLGGLNDNSLIYAITSEIEANPEFHGEEHKYIECAADCFEAGMKKPLNPKIL